MIVEPLAPIPPMPGYYRDEEKRAWLRRLFDDTADGYDRVEAWLSLGTGSRYRRDALQRAGLGQGMNVVDVATGTGLVAREALSIVGPAGRVVGIDPSEAMLARARSKLAIETRTAWADALPVDDETADFVTMGYALRHLEDLHAAFREFSRVLKPDGRVCVLELTRPSSRLARMSLRGYLGLISSPLGRLAGLPPRTSELWRYYWDTIEQCAAPARVTEVLSRAGFRDVSHRLVLGLFSEYTATRG